MQKWRIACVMVLVAATALVWAADRRSYDKSIETVWDEAVKATRDAELELTDSDRGKHWFVVETPKKSLSKTISFEVSLEQAGSVTNVVVKDLEGAGSRKSQKAVAAFFDALEKRMR